MYYTAKPFPVLYLPSGGARALRFPDQVPPQAVPVPEQDVLPPFPLGYQALYLHGRPYFVPLLLSSVLLSETDAAAPFPQALSQEAWMPPA